MEYELIEKIQQYLYLGELFLIAFLLYGYVWYMYRSESKGDNDYEKFARLALDDEIGSEVMSARKTK